MEQRIIDNLQVFLLELGKGFTFVGRQYKITVNNIHYYVEIAFDRWGVVQMVQNLEGLGFTVDDG